MGQCSSRGASWTEAPVAPSTGRLIGQIATAEAPLNKLRTDLEVILVAAPPTFEALQKQEILDIREAISAAWITYERKHWDYIAGVVLQAVTYHNNIMDPGVNIQQALKCGEEAEALLNKVVAKLNEPASYVSYVNKVATPVQLGALKKVMKDHCALLIALAEGIKLSFVGKQAELPDKFCLHNIAGKDGIQSLVHMLGKDEANNANRIRGLEFSIFTMDSKLAGAIASVSASWRTNLESFIKERAKGMTSKAAHICIVQVADRFIKHGELKANTTAGVIAEVYPDSSDDRKLLKKLLSLNESTVSTTSSRAMSLFRRDTYLDDCN